ncbi:response regulator [Azospirillum sp. A1-3]|uniref:response regulator n=1 Tax=Azospirillum sp. A1-3 TaxID=185874 RepID=UPI0020776D5F|nr:response regulator [Azospirillum sp. A1-3]MCM8735480.1 response regulator [Azospirillum sp. A1-3]
MSAHNPILLVENNAKDRDLFLEAYRETGLVHDLVVARDGEEALKLLLPSPDASAALLRPAVVVLDLNLPTLSGYGVLRRLKSYPATRPIPVVVFTSSQDPRHRALCYRLGANAYVAKPVRFSGLATALRVLGRFWTGLNRLPSYEEAALPLP